MHSHLNVSIFRSFFLGTNNNIPNLQTVTVKKEPEEISSTSHHEQAQQIQIQQSQGQGISVSVAPNQSTHTIVETSNTNQSHHIVTQHDGSTSLQIAQVQNLPATHQLTLSNLNQVNQYRNATAISKS